LGLIDTENKRFTEARNSFDKALDKLRLITDKQQRSLLEAMVSGYYARMQAISGNTKQAIALYNAAIYQANMAGIQQRLALSQMYQGLAECYVTQGNKTLAGENTLIGNKLEEEALQFCEAGNTALSFAIVRKAAKPCN
jgi:tetratricopeptide (TPR) repeat protein